MKNSIKDKNNFTTAYGFACGYVERRETDFLSLQLYKEHNIYVVQMLNFQQGVKPENSELFDSFETLGKAKKHFLRLCTKLNFIKYKK